MIGRVTKWETGARDVVNRIFFTAEAQYARGAKPTDTEIETLERRIHARFPTAEFVSMKRTFVPRVNGGEPVRVRWCLEWMMDDDERVVRYED